MILVERKDEAVVIDIVVRQPFPDIPPQPGHIAQDQPRECDLDRRFIEGATVFPEQGIGDRGVSGEMIGGSR